MYPQPTMHKCWEKLPIDMCIVIMKMVNEMELIRKQRAYVNTLNYRHVYHEYMYNLSIMRGRRWVRIQDGKWFMPTPPRIVRRREGAYSFQSGNSYPVIE